VPNRVQRAAVATWFDGRFPACSPALLNPHRVLVSNMQQPSDLSGSDDEAPEEVALSVGKSQATVRHNQERASQAEHVQHLNSRHKRRRSSESEALSEAAPKTSEHKADVDQDALPDEVIEALTST